MTQSTSKLPPFHNPSASKSLICKATEGCWKVGRVFPSLGPYARAPARAHAHAHARTARLNVAKKLPPFRVSEQPFD